MDALLAQGNLLPALLCAIFFAVALARRVALWRARSQSALAAFVDKPLAQLGEREAAKASGTIVAGDRLLTAPLTQRRCVGYTLRFITFIDDHERGDTPIALGSTRAVLDGCWIADRGARAFVSLQHATVLAYHSRRHARAAATGRPSPWDLAPAAVRRACERGGTGAGDLICVEEVLEPGARVTVIGTWGRRPDPGSLAAGNAYREPGFVPQAQGSTTRPLIITDDVARLLAEATDRALLWAPDRERAPKGSSRP